MRPYFFKLFLTLPLFQITDYFVNMYTAPSSPEQCLHNTLILVKAMRSVGIDYDIQATDITDPNPITLLMVRN